MIKCSRTLADVTLKDVPVMERWQTATRRKR